MTDNISTGKAAYLRHIEPPNFSHLVIIRTVLVTPTRLLISPPQQEASNSVTRRYADKLNGIVRVCFSDEEDTLYVCSFVEVWNCELTVGQVAEYTKQADQYRPDVGVMARVRRALKHGIMIGGRRFMPVASSASQQKFVKPVNHLELADSSQGARDMVYRYQDDRRS
jgi:RNA-dependent RNA polymerase